MQNNLIYESHIQKGVRELECVSMKLDGAEYLFDIKLGTWKMNILDKEYNSLLYQNQKDQEIINHSKSNEQIIYEQKLEQLENLRSQIKQIKQKIIDAEEQTNLSKECTDILISTYVKEKLETERIKQAREKLDKVKQEIEQQYQKQQL